jgi:hypothetical protein
MIILPMPAVAGFIDSNNGIAFITYNLVKKEVTADELAASKFLEDFKEFVENRGYILKEILNSDEIGVFWKRMPNQS